MLEQTPDFQKRAIDFADYAARLAAAAIAVWGLSEKVVKPFTEWRRRMTEERKRALAIEMREILKPELDRLATLGQCADRIELVLKRQGVLFEDIDDFLEIATNSRDRLDETNELLDEVFHLERRVNSERRAHIDMLLVSLARRQSDRRREASADAGLGGANDAHRTTGVDGSDTT
jgi:hypothetical protein